MSDSLVTVSYIVAAVLFVLSLAGLSHQETARRGVVLGIAGMVLALAATAAGGAFAKSATPEHGLLGTYGLFAVAVIPAVLVGAFFAARVKMTDMPQLVALLHSFVGAAAVLVGFATLLDDRTVVGHAALEGAAGIIHLVEVFIGVCVGSITFTGSLIAFGKLQGKISGAALTIPGRHAINALMLTATVVLGVVFVGAGDPGTEFWLLLAATVLTGIIGLHLVMAIGGADMPVVVSMLNSYSGWAAAAAGFMLSNDLLIIVGALVGSSGAILSIIMCRGMNRSFISVILGGFGTTSGGGRAKTIEGTVVDVNVAQATDLLRGASKIVVVPGYGMAAAQAQHTLAEVTQVLRDSNVEVRFAIHPVAGRLPGHMNVLLAEARVPYDIVFEMDEINDDLGATDVVLVIGANDIVNPDALDDPDSPIAGMPVLEVWKAKTVIVMKRGMASGYAGIENPLFFRENSRMLFGDAKKNLDTILTSVRAD